MSKVGFLHKSFYHEIVPVRSKHLKGKANILAVFKENNKNIPLNKLGKTQKLRESSKISIEIPNDCVVPRHPGTPNRKRYLKSYNRQFIRYSAPTSFQESVALINLAPDLPYRSNLSSRTSCHVVPIEKKIAHGKYVPQRSLKSRNFSCSPMNVENFQITGMKVKQNEEGKEINYCKIDVIRTMKNIADPEGKPPQSTRKNSENILAKPDFTSNLTVTIVKPNEIPVFDYESIDDDSPDRFTSLKPRFLK